MHCATPISQTPTAPGLACQAAQHACALQAIQGMKLVCLELAQLEQQAEADTSPGAPLGQLPAPTARLLRDSACSLTLDLCQQLHQVRHQEHYGPEP